MKYYIQFILILVSMIWGIKPIVIKGSLGVVTPNEYTLLRILFGAVFSWIFLFFKRDYISVEKKDIKGILFISIIGFFNFQFLYGIGISMTTAGNTAIIMGSLPILVSIINHFFGIEKINRRSMTAILISFIGIILVIFSPGNINFSKKSILGGLIVLFSALGYAIYTVFSKELMKKYPPSQITTFAISITALVMLFISGFRVNIKAINFKLFLSLIYSGVIAMFIANFLWTWAISKSESSTDVSLYNNLNPVFTLIFAYFFLGEKVTIIAFIGVVAILCGLILK
ncbi:DMT family transporter [Hathewaya massiliensis]|uniref:DMT family transporter n=1 Tax=Hathewaya massiliensis TaxID=1964382 RepID=UPI001159FCD6|nr:DMT family transporter [Hathewaya massiliensis]